MRVRLITVTTRRSGTKARREDRQEVEALTVGRGTNHPLSLNGLTISLHHATFHERSGEIYLEPAEARELRVNGELVTGERKLSPGDSVRIGQFELRMMPAEGGDDLVLEVEEIERSGGAREELDKRTRLGVEGGWLSRRALSWGFVIAIVGAFLVAPLTFGGQSAWNSGPVSNNHAFIANDCGACHDGFQRVRDEGCLECHGTIGNHARAEAMVPALANARCASCHLEHNGMHGLAELDQSLCSDCHADPAALVSSTEIGVVTDFDDVHPQFRMHMVETPGAGAEARVRTEWSADLRENSGVCFTHLAHVGQPVADPSGESGYMPCNSCHVEDAAGQFMAPVDFENHCQSCHQLTFDDRPGLEETQAIHADVPAMRRDLEEKYAQWALSGRAQEEDGSDVFDFLRPGQELTDEQTRVVESWVKDQADEAERALTERPGVCADCHRIESSLVSREMPRNEDGCGTFPAPASAVANLDGEAGEQRYLRVDPVEIAERWMPKSEFHHGTHGPFACRDCHPAAAVIDPDAEADEPRPEWARSDARPYALYTPDELRAAHGLEPSESARDVNILGIESCRGCHGGAESRPPLVASSCGLCHPYHRDEHGPMKPSDVAAGPASFGVHAAWARGLDSHARSADGGAIAGSPGSRTRAGILR